MAEVLRDVVKSEVLRDVGEIVLSNEHSATGEHLTMVREVSRDVIARMVAQIVVPVDLSDSTVNKVTIEHDFINSRSTARLVMRRANESMHGGGGEEGPETSKLVANRLVTEMDNSQHERVRSTQQESSSGGRDKRQRVKRNWPACKSKNKEQNMCHKKIRHTKYYWHESGRYRIFCRYQGNVVHIATARSQRTAAATGKLIKRVVCDGDAKYLRTAIGWRRKLQAIAPAALLAKLQWTQRRA
eukprot:TRINITY_DN95925_c0_g1_i1.p1 TRINITY_DN95925_c0_g1~~TRINITY_DN95925_c0_g1_i1.p1  ORF type:complete len:243 (+),score=24.20 TRINITY_DN95925_c0_g1_i1:183-911(+)